MRPTVVLAYTGLGGAMVEQDVLQAAGVDVIAVPSLDSDEGRSAAAVADALMVTVQPVRAELLAAMPHCRIICRVGTGVDAIDIAAATERRIWVTNVPDYSVDEVSTHALTLLLALARNLQGHLRAAADGDWHYLAATPIRRLRGRTLGILGFGRIGSTVGRKGHGLGLRVIACDPNISRSRITETGAEAVDFPTLLAESDFLSLHVPLTDETRRIIDQQALAQMGSQAYLINTSRGEVVDVDALVAAVQGGHLAGAALDVLPSEPPPSDAPILREPRILVTPHVAWASEEAAIDVRQRAAEDVVRVLNGQRPRFPLNDIDLTAVTVGE